MVSSRLTHQNGSKCPLTYERHVSKKKSILVMTKRDTGERGEGKGGGEGEGKGRGRGEGGEGKEEREG